MPLFGEILDTGKIQKDISTSVFNYLKGYTQQEKDRDAALQKKGIDPIRSYLTWNSGLQPTGSSATGDLGLTSTQQEKLVFHVLKSAQHEFTSQVTTYPVEDSSDIADHIQLENARFTISVLFSDATTEMIKKSKDASGSFGQLDSYLKLQTLRDNRQTVALRTPLGIFTNLVITSIGIPKSIDQGRSLYVDMTLEEIRVVSTTTTSVDFTVKKKDNQAQAKGKVVKDSCAAKTEEGVKPVNEIIDIPPTDPKQQAINWLKTVGG